MTGKLDRHTSERFVLTVVTAYNKPMLRSPWNPQWRTTLLRASLVATLATGLHAQAIAGASPQTTVSGPEGTAEQALSMVTGSVRDAHGTAVANVRLTLVGQDNSFRQTTIADKEGTFTFRDVPAGSYTVKVEGGGIEPFTSDATVVTAGEQHSLTLQAVRIPMKTTTVEVYGSIEEQAKAQVKQQEQQRVLGLLPNYYTSYIWDAAPMSPKLKFGMARRTVFDPVSAMVVAGIAGTEQWHKTFPGYGLGAQGYAKRFGATYADTLSSRMFGSAIYPTIFHQDPRYFYHGSGSVRSRLLYAIKFTFVCRGDNGQMEPNYSHILGSFTAAGISNLYRTPQDRQAGLTFRNGLIITASGAFVNVLREFVSRQATPNVPTYENGKP